MTLLITILIVLVCLLLIGIILIQKPKGGGLGSSFGASSNILGGVQKTNEFLDKATWGLAAALLVLVLATNLGSSSANTEEGVERSQMETTDAPATEVPMNTGGMIQTDLNTEENGDQ